MKLIDSKLSGNAWKIRLVLRYLARDFERETLNLADGQHRESDFAALNPFHRIPVLQLESGASMYESGSILLYLTEGTALLPADPVARARVTAWLFFEQSDLLRFLAYPRFYTLTGQAENRAREIDLYHDLAQVGLKRVAQALDAGDWVCGAELTVADFALYPYIKLAPEGGLDMTPWPQIAGWMTRFESLPGYEPLVS